MLKSPHFCVRLIAVLMLLNTAVIATPPGSTNEAMSYYCGDVEFSEEAVQMAIEAGLRKYYELQAIPALYDGPLYPGRADSLTMFPIMEDFNAPATTQDYRYFVIFGWSSGEVEIIARAPQDDWKCLKMKSGLHPPSTYSPLPFNFDKPTNTPNNIDGYKCGQKFISNVIISKAVNLAKLQRTWKNLAYSVKIYKVRCEPNTQCLIWPIYEEKNTHVSGNNNNSGLKYFIVTDMGGNLKYVAIASAASRPHKKCAPVPNTQSVQVNPNIIEHKTEVESGYQCGMIFFRNSYLVLQIEKAKMNYKEARRSKKTYVYPKIYNKAPFPTGVLIWPVLPGGTSFIQGRPNMWFLVMDKNHNKICVAVKLNGLMECCDSKIVYSSGDVKIVDTSSDEEKDNFTCQRDFSFTNQQMTKARDQACKAKGNSKSKYPAPYHGPKFDVPGPYLTYPLIGFNLFRSNAGLFRIVINEECKLAGVLMVSSKGQFSKCQRSKDLTTPGGDSDIPIYEGNSPIGQK